MTLHQNVLTALDHQVLRYQNSKSYKELEDERLLDEAIDETGTVPCPIAGGNEESQVNVEEQIRKEIRQVSNYLLEVHGVPPGQRERRSQDSFIKISMGCSQPYQVRMRS